MSISSTGEGATGNNDSSEAPAGHDDAGNEPDKKQGPWKRIAQEQQVQPPPEPEKPVEPPPRSGAAGGYVPPHLRNKSSQIQPSRNQKTKVAPDIHNEEYFPTLSGSKPTETQGAWGKRLVQF